MPYHIILEHLGRRCFFFFDLTHVLKSPKIVGSYVYTLPTPGQVKDPEIQASGEVSHTSKLIITF